MENMQRNMDHLQAENVKLKTGLSDHEVAINHLSQARVIDGEKLYAFVCRTALFLFFSSLIFCFHCIHCTDN